MIEIYILEIILWLAVLFSLTSGIVYMRRLWNRNRIMRHRETFQTHAEAEAFIRGIDFMDNDHVSTEGPEPELDDYGQPEYAVYVTEFYDRRPA